MKRDGATLIGDVGGTNARFAVATDHGYDQERVLTCADFDTLADALRQYLRQIGGDAPRGIFLAAAGPVVNASIKLTNSHWHLTEADLGAAFPAARVKLLNDFEAMAYALPLLEGDDLLGVGPHPPTRLAGRRSFTVGVVGPGTGLGVAGLIGRDAWVSAITGEGGHLGFAPESDLQLSLLAELRRDFPRVSDERLVSGSGIENVYRAICRLSGADAQAADAAAVFAGAAQGDPACEQAVAVFYEVLGQVAGNLALTLGAADGIYIAGGVAQRYPELLCNSAFRRGFENKGRHGELMTSIPTQLIVHPQPGLLGVSYYARKVA